MVGRLVRLDIETRPVVLLDDDGTRWELELPPGWVIDADPAARVVVRGTPVDDVVSTTQAGPMLRVTSIARPATE